MAQGVEYQCQGGTRKKEYENHRLWGAKIGGPLLELPCLKILWSVAGGKEEQENSGCPSLERGLVTRNPNVHLKLGKSGW